MTTHTAESAAAPSGVRISQSLADALVQALRVKPIFTQGFRVEKPASEAENTGICFSLYSRLGLTAGIIKELYSIVSALARG